jgi:oxygen-dependent protoporphyrinogen oxidase
MKPIAIIGAGVTGLTAAFCLKRQGLAVTVYEAGARAGGVIQSIRKDGFLAENGPSTILETSPDILQLIRGLNLESRRLYTRPEAVARFVVRGKQPVAMPSSQLGIFTSPLLSLGAKFALLREPFITPRRDGAEESIAEFVTRRLNREFLECLIDAMVAGIYAGDTSKLSVRHAFPRLAALETKYGSLIKGQMKGARERKKTGQVSRDRAPKFSFDEGLQVLTDTLATQVDVKYNTPVTRLAKIADGWRITTSAGEAEHSAIVYCGTAFRLAELQITTDKPIDVSLFSEIRYPPVASVVLGFRREDVVHPCQGFGMLIPKIEGFKILGTIFSSALFPNRAPAGHVLLSSYVGGERNPALAALPPDELVKITCEDLAALLGVKGRPVFQYTALYPRAIPQYNVGYGKFKDRLNEIEASAPGLFFAGHFRDGVSLGDSIASGYTAAGRIKPILP